MNIELHIEELVLDGFEPHQRYEIADALQARLGEILAERGLPPSLAGDLGTIDAGSIPLGPRTGTSAADAIYGGLSRVRPGNST